MRNERSRQQGSAAGGRGGGAAPGREVGWGIAAEDEQEGIFLRRVLFTVLIVVVGVMGAWFMMTTVTNAGKEPLTGRMQTAQFTVELLRFPAARLEAAEALMAQQEIRDLAGRERLFVEDRPEGYRALCCGEFLDADEAGAALLRFQNYRTRSNKLGFPDAAVIRRSP